MRPTTKDRPAAGHEPDARTGADGGPIAAELHDETGAGVHIDPATGVIEVHSEVEP